MSNKSSSSITYEAYVSIIDAIRPEQTGTPEWSAYWQQNIKLSQQVTHYEIEDTQYVRIPYGKEGGGWDAELLHGCHDCAVKKGQLHVLGCDVECCPKCHGQAISCDCVDEDEDEDEDE